MSSDPLSLTTGQKLGRYELLLPIARGGMGQVWIARLRGARGFHKLVAIKTLLCLRGEEERLERMLLEEARIASLIQHSNVAQTLELGDHEGTLYLVMEWVDGEPLSAMLAAAEQVGGVPLLVAVNLIGQTLRGLQAAHELVDEHGALLGVVHRDVSPHNILVSYSGVVKVVDFGIAQAVNQEPTRATDEVQGKFGYMAPEQILGGTVDQRTDLFSVGVLLYLLTTGRHPFKDHAAEGLLHGIVSEEPAIRPSLVKPGYSRTLEAVVMKALDKDRERRWPSAEEMRLALERGVPQAFGLGFESQVRNFMGDLAGESASAKREALRRAELAADLYLAESAMLNEAGPGSSAGSLRAILIDQANVATEAPPARRSRAPTLRPLLEAARARGAGPWSILVGGVALAAAALVALALRTPSAPARAVSASGSDMVELTPARPTTLASASSAAASAALVLASASARSPTNAPAAPSAARAKR